MSVDGSVSSQFLTALLMTAPLAPQDTIITIKGDLVSKPYIDITLHLMKTFGVDVENQQYQRFVVRGGQRYQSPGHYTGGRGCLICLLFPRRGGNKRRHG